MLDIHKALSDHASWLDSKGSAGVCANLCGTDLTGTDLTGTDLTGTDLTGANLTGANLPKEGA